MDEAPWTQHELDAHSNTSYSRDAPFATRDGLELHKKNSHYEEDLVAATGNIALEQGASGAKQDTVEDQALQRAILASLKEAEPGPAAEDAVDWSVGEGGNDSGAVVEPVTNEGTKNTAAVPTAQAQQQQQRQESPAVAAARPSSRRLYPIFAPRKKRSAAPAATPPAVGDSQQQQDASLVPTPLPPRPFLPPRRRQSTAASTTTILPAEQEALLSTSTHAEAANEPFSLKSP